MAGREVSLPSARWFGALISLILLTNVAVLLDVPVLRQLFGFIFLTFIPGILLLFALKLNKLSLLEKIVLSMGLSFAFSLSIGLVLNGALVALGYGQPLSAISLLVSFTLANTILAIIAYTRNKNVPFSFSALRLATREKAFLILPSLFPLLSLVGIRLMNLRDNNILLLLLLLLIPIYVLFLAISHGKVPERIYPGIIFFISISLLLMYSLRSNHIIGSDTHREYFLFLTASDNLRWGQIGFEMLDAMVGISLLPAIYQTFLQINPEFLFKLFPSLVVSILPLVIYLLTKKHVGGFYALLASVFTMAQIYFLETPSHVRSNIAVVFFALALWVIFHEGIDQLSKKVFIIILLASIIFSHYGTTYVAFFVLLFTWLGTEVLCWFLLRWKGGVMPSAGNPSGEGDPPDFPSPTGSPWGGNALAGEMLPLERPQISRGITFTVIILFLVMLFLWYSQMTTSSFFWGVRFVYDSFINWRWFLTEGAGGQPVQAALGRTLSAAGMAQRIEFVFSWLTIILASIGLLATMLKFKTMVSTHLSRNEKPSFLLRKLEIEYLVLSVGCFFLLAATVVLPYVSEMYGTVRTYFQMVVVLAVFFVIGGIEVARYLRLQPCWLILAVLLPYFLSTSGVIPQVLSYPRAVTLNSKGPIYSDMYISDGENYAAQWLRDYSEPGITIYANGFTVDVLLSQGKIPAYYIKGSRISRFIRDIESESYVYLRYQDITEEVTATHPDMFGGRNKVYANTRAEVYR